MFQTSLWLLRLFPPVMACTCFDIPHSACWSQTSFRWSHETCRPALLNCNYTGPCCVFLHCLTINLSWIYRISGERGGDSPTCLSVWTKMKGQPGRVSVSQSQVRDFRLLTRSISELQILILRNTKLGMDLQQQCWNINLGRFRTRQKTEWGANTDRHNFHTYP